MAKNVRFVRTTKARWLARDTYDPLALYFCEDTGEMFKGDQVYTDGIRVLPTKADLPSCPCAADGVIYYITETRNGYMMAPDRSGWLQTIYAPVTDAYTVPESEIYNTVTTVGAVRDIEAKIYERIEAHEALVGELPEDADATTIVDYINEKTANIAEDTVVKELDRRVTATEREIDIIKADYLVGADKTELANAIANEKTRAEAAEARLQSQLDTITDNPDIEEIIKAIDDFSKYIDEHGEIAEGFRIDIEQNKEDISKEIDRAMQAEEEIINRLDSLGDVSYDAYTAADAALKSELEGKIDAKADKATTLKGYNISDAYTKTEVHNIIANAGTGVQYAKYIADGEETLTVEIANNHIIQIDGYRYVNITMPSSLHNLELWDCYFYIAFRQADSVALHLPETVRITGDKPSYALPGDLWEISINNHGGAVCMIHRYQASLDAEE